MAFTLTVKSTPLSVVNCPRKAREVILGEEHTVTSNGGTEYQCTCGEVFDWEDQFHWETAPLGS